MPSEHPKRAALAAEVPKTTKHHNALTTTAWFLGIVLLAFVQESARPTPARITISLCALVAIIPAWFATQLVIARYWKAELRLCLTFFLLGHLWLLGNAVRVATYGWFERPHHEGGFTYFFVIRAQAGLVFGMETLALALVAIFVLALTHQVRSHSVSNV